MTNSVIARFMRAAQFLLEWKNGLPGQAGQ
jgi:hypothetical protein